MVSSCMDFLLLDDCIDHEVIRLGYVLECSGYSMRLHVTT